MGISASSRLFLPGMSFALSSEYPSGSAGHSIDTSLPFATGDLTVRACNIFGRIISETKQFSSTPYTILSFGALFQTTRRCQGTALLPFFSFADGISAVCYEFSHCDSRAKGAEGTGKTIGIILGELLETVLDDPAQNNHETLLKIANKIRKGNSQR
jgi:hypothetical protein